MKIDDHPYPSWIIEGSKWIYQDDVVAKVAAVAIGLFAALSIAAFLTSSLALGITTIVYLISCHVLINFTRHVNDQEARRQCPHL